LIYDGKNKRVILHSSVIVIYVKYMVKLNRFVQQTVYFNESRTRLSKGHLIYVNKRLYKYLFHSLTYHLKLEYNNIHRLEIYDCCFCSHYIWQ